MGFEIGGVGLNAKMKIASFLDGDKKKENKSL